ncbi:MULTISPECIES: ead/Ea22-like family protein [Burkholderia]|uniref:ead/Ea22-like family protein n=1 Tax=Burkholderia TaxID=32008 RepID=UPI001641CABF|nr:MULTISPECIES: ead/Ea22-like family protein [Burkholderia]
MEKITSNYDALQAAAEKATKGNWINVGAWVENEDDDLKDICDCRPNGSEDYDQASRDAAFIALAHPDTILRLLSELRIALDAAPAEPCEPVGIVHRPAPNGEDFSIDWLRPPATGARLYDRPVIIPADAGEMAPHGYLTRDGEYFLRERLKGGWPGALSLYSDPIAALAAGLTIDQRAILTQAADFLEQKHSRLAAVTLRGLLAPHSQAAHSGEATQ